MVVMAIAVMLGAVLCFDCRQVVAAASGSDLSAQGLALVQWYLYVRKGRVQGNVRVMRRLRDA